MNASHPLPYPLRRNPRTALAGCLAAVAAVLLAGCSVNSAGIGDDGDAELTNAVGSATADYVVVDLATGSAAPAITIPDLATNPSYRTSQMVFKRVRGLGDDFLIGVFEVSQAQWTAIAGTPSSGFQPWDPSIIDPALVGAAAVGPTRPAFNLSYARITAALEAYSAGRQAHFGVPTTTEWVHACTAGSAGAWSWGDGTDYATLYGNAVVYETQGDTVGTRGPQPVGGRSPNAFGLYDMHGNVWEWSSPGTTIHGGSWHDSYAQARIANQPGLLDAGIIDLTSHALVGVRLKLSL